MAKYEVWSRGKDVRTITVYHLHGVYNVKRYYGKCHKDFAQWVAESSARYGDSLNHLTRTVMVTNGRDVRADGLSEDGAKDVIDRFRKSAEKAGFEKLGQYESQA